MKLNKKESTARHLVKSKTGWWKVALRAELFLDCKPQCDRMTKVNPIFACMKRVPEDSYCPAHTQLDGCVFSRQHQMEPLAIM